MDPEDWRVFSSQKPEIVSQLAKSALEGALFYPEGPEGRSELHVYLSTIADGHIRDATIAVSFDEKEKANGVCLLLTSGQVLIYIKDEDRLRGFGRRLITAVKQLSRKRGAYLFGYPGKTDVSLFWIKHGILYVEPGPQHASRYTTREQALELRQQLWEQQQRQYRERVGNETYKDCSDGQ